MRQSSAGHDIPSAIVRNERFIKELEEEIAKVEAEPQ